MTQETQGPQKKLPTTLPATLKVKLIDEKDANYSKEKLEQFYKEGLIPAEKKSYLTDLKESIGPYMGIEVGPDKAPHYMLDAASQIATLGLGFNATPLFGASHFLESWTNESHTERVEELITAYHNFFKRKLGWKKLSLNFCNSGAEANETALGLMFKNRVNKNARKVVAFEGSFHGRMMVTLMSTWNKSKREPFEWDDFKTTYCKFPELPDANIHLDMTPEWKNIWANAGRNDFVAPKGRDEIENNEIKSLMEVREAIKDGEVFALITELMQCEGGDRYGSDRFFSALLLLCKSFNVAVVFDEVQTGFHLGHDFFWHKNLKLTDDQNRPLLPDAITMAKKAQIGIVASSHFELDSSNLYSRYGEYSVAGLVRGYLHAHAIDQSTERIQAIEEMTKELLTDYLKKWEKYTSNPRIKGMAFAFELNDAATAGKFVAKRFDKGLLYYPAGEKTLRFRLNTNFTKADLEILFERLDALSCEIFEETKADTQKEVEIQNGQNEKLYEFQTMMLEYKFGLSKVESKLHENLAQKIQNFFKNEFNVNFLIFDALTYNRYRNAIVELESIVYEPVRQTAIKHFDATMKNPRSVAVGIVKGEKLLAIAFAGPLKTYPLERGLRVDPYFENPDVLYMLDTTLHPSLSNIGIGKYLKYAITLIAANKGIKRLQGRNRDKMAASMLGINLSLGALEQDYMKEDYPDFEKYRDVIYYTCPLDFKNNVPHLSSGITAPLRQSDFNIEDIHELLPTLVNKICLSNFVSQKFLKSISDFSKFFPSELRHGYTTSGQSEAVDKIAKTLWFNDKRPNKTPHHITFKGHYFGMGSFLSRSLTNSFNSQEDSFFPVTHLDAPNGTNDDEVLKNLETELKKRESLGVWIEPIPQKMPTRISQDFLKKLKVLCHKYQTPLIYNETASQLYRYDSEYFSASNLQNLTPDAVMVFQGGQAGMVLTREEYFLKDPLMLISTWDGDEHSLYLYMKALNHIQQNKQNVLKNRDAFTQKLKEMVGPFGMTDFNVEHGIGYFTAILPPHLRKYFTPCVNRANTYLVFPSDSAIRDFLDG